MDRKDFRSLLSKFTGSTKRHSTAPARLLRSVGRAMGLDGRLARLNFENLESRQLLEGSFASVIANIGLNGAGEGFSVPGNGANVINPAVTSTDNDWYSFTAPANDFVSVLADTANESPASALNTRIEIYDAAGQLIASGVNNGTLTSGVATDGWAGFVAQAGQVYKIRVSSDYPNPRPNLTANNTYTVRIAAQSARFDIGGKDPLSGIAREQDSPPPGNPLPPITPILGQLGGLGPAANRIRQDDIVYKFVVPDGPEWNNLVTVNAQSTQNNLTRRLDTRLDVYNAQGQLVTNASDSDAGRINDAFTVFRARPGETFYIRVRSDEIRNTNPELATGPFFLVLDAITTEIALNRVTRAGAALGQAMVGFGQPSTNPDPFMGAPAFQTSSFEFTALGTGLAIINVTPAGLSPVIDGALRLYDDNGNLVAFNNDFAGQSPLISAILEGGKRYFVVVDSFALPNGSQFNIAIESNVTQNQNPGPEVVDDHPNTPAGGDINDVRRRFELATGLFFNTPTPVFDADGNVVQDHGLITTATGQGRIEGAGDSDLFQFTPPMSMRGTHDGDNDDGGRSLFIGGAYDAGNPNSPWPTLSRDLTAWDASDYFHTGAQFFDPVFGVTYGFNDNTDASSLAPRAEIHAMLDYDPGAPTTVPAGMSRRWLVVAGDFDLIIPGPDGLPVTIKNIAVWRQNTTNGNWFWSDILGNADGPINALTSYLPDQTFQSRDDPDEQIDSDRPTINGQAVPYLVAGGVFTSIDGAPAANIATFDLVNGWVDRLGGTNGPVHALTVYNPPDPGAERPASPGPPVLPGVSESRDIPNSLIVGGQFTNFGGAPVSNLGLFDGVDIDNVWGGPFDLARGGAGPNGPVFALTTYIGWDPDGPIANPIPAFPAAIPGEIGAPDRVLVVGGQFTSISDGEGGNIPAANVAAWGFVGAAPGFTQQPDRPDYGPLLGWEQVGDGITTPNEAGDPVAVRALTEWDAPDVNNGTIGPVLVIGGSFLQDVRNNLTAFAVDDATDTELGFGWFNASRGVQGIVRALAAVTTDANEDEPSIATDLLSGTPQTVLYVGGDITGFWNTANPAAQPTPTSGVVQYSAVFDANTNTDVFRFFAMDGGVGNLPNSTSAAPTVFALAAFDDGNPLAWDRHDRPADRIAISVSRNTGSLMDALVRVFDSNFNVIYSNDRINPLQADPAGSINPALAAPGFDTTRVVPPMWAGAVYYIEVTDVTGTGTGRYTLNVTMIAPSEDLNNDGVQDDVNAQVFDEPDSGRFSDALNWRINTQLPTGDGENIRNSANTWPTANPIGNNRRVQHVTPSLGDNGSQIREGIDLGNIHDRDDTDIYSFRAEFTGYAEIRIDTTLLATQYGETYAATHPQDFTGETGVINSYLDAALRIFRNDFVQIGYNDDNYATAGDYAVGINGGTNVGTIGGSTGGLAYFTRRDPRVVIPVVAGNFYFIQVESGQKWVNGRPEDEADRIEVALADREIRADHGAYRLMVNQMPNQQAEIVNGQQVLDDHAAFIDLATPIAIGDDPANAATNGRGTILGQIRNTPLNPTDVDMFEFFATGTGPVTLNLRPTGTGNGLRPQFLIFRYGQDGNLEPNPLATGSPLSGGGVTATLPNVVAGQKFLIRVVGEGNSQGAYQLDVIAPPVRDDVADAIKFGQATEIRLFDFQGLGSASGELETPGDTDTFKFRVNDYNPFSITVTGSDATITPRIIVYEVGEDLSGNGVLMRIGDGAAQSTGVNNTVTVTFPVTPDRSIRDQNGDIVRTYPYYYVVVKDANPVGGFGRYNISVNFEPTDDHPDGDTDLDGTYDTVEFPQATTIALDSNTGQGSTTGIIEVTSDSDLFTFTAPAGGTASIVVSRPPGSTIRTRVTVLDAAANIIATGTAADDLINTTAIASFLAARGTTYFVVVEGFEDGVTPNVNTTATGEYTVSVLAPPVDDYPNATEFPLANATANIPIVFSTGRGQIGGTAGGDPLNPRFEYAGDTDLFTFVAIRNGSITVTMTPFDTASGRIAPTMKILDSQGNTIADYGLGAARLQTITLTFTGVAGQRYYILTDAVEGVPLANETGEYALTIQGPAASGGDGPTPDSIDFNAPTVITLNDRTGDGSASDVINVVNDRDLFRFTTTAAGKVFVQLQAGNGSLLRASIRVLNAANELVTSEVAFDSDGVPGSIAYVTFEGAAASTYYIVVDGLGDSVGAYTVKVNTQPLVNQLVYPEGYANANVREFISIVNPNNETVTYQVILRYETGELETVIATRTIRANARNGVTIIDPSTVVPGLRLNTPYAIIINSSKPLGATLAHYDFGNSIGDSFTETTAATWHFPRVEKDPAVADFVLFYNPNNFDVYATLTANIDGESREVTLRFGANRRGGFAINDAANFPLGVYGATLTVRPVDSANNAAFIGVVASLSHYNVVETQAFGHLGDSTGGSTSGVITNIAQGNTISSEVEFYNPGSSPATVSITGSYIRTTLPSFNRVIQVPAKSVIRLTGETLGLAPDQPVGLTYTSNVPIVATSAQNQNGDSDSTNASTTAANQVFFGDAYIDSRFPGLQEEALYFYNPGSVVNNISVRIAYVDGTTDTLLISVPARGFREIQLHQLPEILDRNTTLWFGIDASSDLPFVANMVHYDLALNGGWATSGVQFGIATPLAKIS